jgi:ribosomal protein L31
MRKGIHPMMHMVRVVLSNGASYYRPMAWQLPVSRKGEIPTKFLEVDYINHEAYTGVPSRNSRRLGRRAKFENKFVTSPTPGVVEVTNMFSNSSSSGGDPPKPLSGQGGSEDTQDK